MDDILKSLGSVIPEKWRMTLGLLIAVSPFIGRVFQSIRTQGGLKGILAAIWLGTNVPKDPPKP